ncbi:MAG TPA: hypothetical protein VMJ93_07720 [Verrucomicrobiae bacterium]|nr:hypothetical protein [Verrucomicrobiae bacterium]
MSIAERLDEIHPVPPAIRRAYIQSRKSAADPPSVVMEGPEAGTVATADDIAAMAAVAVSDLSSRIEPRRPSSAPSPSLDLAQHRRRCAVCKHRDCPAIEEAFLQWRNVIWLVKEFSLPDRSSVYRHAHAFGLFPRRKANLRFALEHVIEEAERVRPNASAVVEAARAYAHIDDQGAWIEPPTTHFVLPGRPVPRARIRRPVRHTPGNRK